MSVEKLAEGIFRVKIPFENIYTSAFFLETEEGVLVVDSGSSDADAERHILPALQGRRVAMLACSHLHGDHAGGVGRLLTAFPKVKLALFAKENPYSKERIRRLEDGELLFGRYQVYNLRGHTADCLGILDRKTNSLLTFDSLQLGGVGRYPAFTEDRAAYLQTVARVRGLGVEQIFTSHEYEPYGFRAGKGEIDRFLDACIANI